MNGTSTLTIADSTSTTPPTNPVAPPPAVIGVDASNPGAAVNENLVGVNHIVSGSQTAASLELALSGIFGWNHSPDVRVDPDLASLLAGGINGINGTIRSLLIEHGQSPFAVTLSVEPMWHSLTETSGAAVSTYGLETKIEADAELIKNRLFYAFNALYAPETTIAEGAASTWHPEGTLGLSSALAFQVVPNVVIGADLRYLLHYESLATGAFTVSK